MKTVKLHNIVIALFIGVLVMGCSPQRRAKETANQSSLLKVSLGVSLTNSDNWRCPPAPNVRLKDYIGVNGYDYSGQNDYTVCVSRDAVNTFMVIPNQPTAREVCVYPLRTQTGYTNLLQLVETPKCFKFNDENDPFEVSFNSQSISEMVIVDRNFTQQMNSCLSSVAACPSYTKGFVQ